MSLKSSGVSTCNECSRALTCTVLPSPISSASNTLPLCFTPNLTPSLWKGYSWVKIAPGMWSAIVTSTSAADACSGGEHFRAASMAARSAAAAASAAASAGSAPRGMTLTALPTMLSLAVQQWQPECQQEHMLAHVLVTGTHNLSFLRIPSAIMRTGDLQLYAG